MSISNRLRRLVQAAANREARHDGPAGIQANLPGVEPPVVVHPWATDRERQIAAEIEAMDAAIMRPALIPDEQGEIESYVSFQNPEDPPEGIIEKET